MYIINLKSPSLCAQPGKLIFSWKEEKKYEDLTKEELYDKTLDYKIEAWSDMNKEELINALTSY